MHEFLARVFALLYAIHPTVPYLALPAAIWLAALATRKWLPSAWRFLERIGPKKATASRIWLALPSIMAGAVVAANTAGHNMWDAMIAAACAAGAPLLHHALKSIPWLPYVGELGRGKDDDDLPPPRKKQERIIVGSLAVLCALMLTGCIKGMTPAQHADRETCYAKARLNFHESTESCQTEACIDDLAGDYQREQEACK